MFARHQLKRQVLDLVTSLGSTTDCVIGRLRAEGVTGDPGEQDSCAIANYLSAVVGSDPRVRSISVSGWWMVVRYGRGRRFSIRTPDHIRVFIRHFDAGLHPDLVTSVVRSLGTRNITLMGVPPGTAQPEQPEPEPEETVPSFPEPEKVPA